LFRGDLVDGSSAEFMDKPFDGGLIGLSLAMIVLLICVWFPIPDFLFDIFLMLNILMLSYIIARQL
jgi:flagellar biosynthesis component FlhA